jgi:hypothetical protein
MILKMILAASRAIVEPARHNRTGALAGFIVGGVLGVGLAIGLHVLAAPGPGLAVRCIGLGALFALLGSVLVAQLSYHASSTGNPSVVDIPRRPRAKR